ncbi:MAG TPA: hypothetical protein VKA68_01500 [bacterium]|nr:hypothetical protein [bacterium]
MNIGIVGSFVTAGILIISLLSLRLSLYRNATQSALDLMCMMNVQAVSEIVEHDFTKIGYGASADIISAADSNQVTFLSDINDDGTVNTVTWRYNRDVPIPSTPNPNDHQLRRTVDGTVNDIQLTVTSFSLDYFTATGTVTSNPDSIRQLRVVVICQAPEAYGGRYAQSSWQKTYIPINFYIE